MSYSHAQIVQLHLTAEEWRHLDAIAQLRSITVEELLREGLGLPLRERLQPPPRRPHLRAVAPPSAT
jgi:hypothetical protein